MKYSDFSESDIGSWAVYHSYGKPEIGRISSIGEKHIYIVFNCGGNWGVFQNYTGQATKPEDIIAVTSGEKHKCRANGELRGSQAENDI